MRLLNPKQWLLLLTLTFWVSNSYAKFILSAQELLPQLTNVVVLDARSPQLYESGHIEGARNFPVDSTFAAKSVDGSIVQPTEAQALLRQLGIDSQTPVVIYDNGALMDAARLFWTLEVYGIKNLKVLDRGYAGWSALNYPLSLDTTKPTPSDYVAKIDHHRIATKLTTLAATRNPTQVIIDARSTSDYQGKTSSAKRFGHIPSALSIPASQNVLASVQEGAQFLSTDQLAALYQHVPKDNRIILYCAIGRVSSANYLALRTLGYDVANYDASWQQWGNDDTLPITQPSTLGP